MATYLGIHGGKIQDYTTDPDNPITGEVWYNSTANTIKIESATTAGSWAAGGNLNTARYDAATGLAGNKSSALYAGGYTTTIVANVETYNGTAWTETTDIPTATYAFGGTGASSTSALVFGGQTPGSPATTATYEWGGSSWTTGGTLNSGQRYRRGAGIQTAALAVGGNGGTPPMSAETEQYNGSNWTEVGDLNTARTAGSLGGGAQPNTAALYFGGYPVPSGGAYTELWNGSNWTEVNDLNTARQYVSGAGTTTSALAFGGGVVPPMTADTEIWNGTNWTETTNMSTARYGSSGAGASSASAIAAGGTTPGATNAVELWTGAGAGLTRTFTDS